MDFINKHWFNIVVLLIILICIILISVYEFQQQDIERQQQLAALNNSCQRLASQKKQELTQDSDLFLNIYEYKYNPTYEACILAYSASNFGALSDLLGPYIFEVDNLSTGESILSKRVSPGTAYASTTAEFTKLQAEYIGSTTPIK